MRLAVSDAMLDSEVLPFRGFVSQDAAYREMVPLAAAAAVVVDDDDAEPDYLNHPVVDMAVRLYSPVHLKAQNFPLVNEGAIHYKRLVSALD